jgi:rubrerythrin
MSDSGEVGVSGYARLHGQKSLQEILQVATEFERTARDFYADLSLKVSKNIRYLVEELAEEEQQHFNLFSALLQNPDVLELMQSRLEVPASDGKFSDCIHLPDLGESPDDQAVLQYALYREHAAMEQYGSLAKSCEAGPLRDAFSFLADEETKHKQALEKRYYEIVHSGGV